MNRYATFLAVVTLATGFVALRTADEQTSYESVDLQDTLTEDQKVQNMVAQYRAFKGTFATTIDSLRSGQIHLKEALTLVRDAANQYHPRYLKLLNLSDKGESQDARIARNLVGHVRTTELYHPTNPSPLPGLEKELREFLEAVGE